MDPRFDETLARCLFQHSADAFLLVDVASAEIAATSPSAARLLGQAVDEIDGQALSWIFEPDEAVSSSDVLVDWLQHSQGSKPLCCRQKHDSAELSQEAVFHLYRVDRGECDAVAVIRFVCDTAAAWKSRSSPADPPDESDDRYRILVQQANRQREALIRELEARNTELERFAYTVSHDLKSPLITIKGFLGFLEKDVAEQNIEHLKNDMAMITSAADTMMHLLDDILELSRIGRISRPSENVDLNAVVHEVCQALATQIDKTKTTMAIAPNLPTVFGDRTRLVEVLLNLVDNALKFAASSPQPHVEIGSRAHKTGALIYVRDNGIGIEPAYFDRVFEVFEKLDRDSEGTGIGLAIVRRIVEVHGGQVWVESDGLGHGCTFYIALPDARPPGSLPTPNLNDGELQGENTPE